MATSWNITGSNFIKSGTNGSITQCTGYDENGFFSSGGPYIGKYTNFDEHDIPMTWGFLVTRFQITPTTRVKSVTLTIQHRNKSHGYGSFISYYARAGGSWPAFPETSGTAIGQLPTSGTFTVTVPLSSPTSSAFYVYVWGVPADLTAVGEYDQIVEAVTSLVCNVGGALIYAKVDGTTWKLAKSVHAKTNSSTWKEVKSAHAKTNSATWKEAT